MTIFKPTLIVALLAGLLLFAACGGGSDSSGDSPGKVPTATLPANLPEPIILDGTPGAPADTSFAGDTYVVEAGDYPYLIAEKLGVDADELIRLNNLEDPSGLYVGQVLKVPGRPQATAAPGRTPTVRPTSAPTAEPEATSTPGTAPTPSDGQTTYSVQSGDNAADIAARFGITVEELAAANNTTVENLRSLDVGDVLIIPAASAAAPEEQPTEPPTEAPVENPIPEP